MPEGDTIFRSARTLDRALSGLVVTSFETHLAQLAAIDRGTPVAGRSVAAGAASGRNTTGRLNPRARLFVYGRAGTGCHACGARIQSVGEIEGRRT